MLTTKKVARSAAAKDIVAYLSEELTAAQAPTPGAGATADYYAQGTTNRLASYYAASSQSPVRLGSAVTAEVAEFLGVDRTGAPSSAVLEKIISGQTATGQTWLSDQAENTGFDYTFSADRSVSVAYALAPTADERAAILGAHREAVADVMAEIQLEMGFTRRGAGGTETVAGHLAWVEFDHSASRPVSARALYCGDPDAPPHDPDTLLTGDPNLHTHAYVPNFVFTRDADGQVHIGTIDSERLRGRVHEFGALYQARLAHHLERLGVEIEWDGRGAVRAKAIPEEIRELFSKRARAGEAAARAWATERGLSYDDLDPVAQHKMMRAALGLDRQTKEGVQGAFEDWGAQAKAAGYEHQGVIPSDDDLGARPAAKATKNQRLAAAVQQADQIAGELFTKESVLTLQQIRVCCAQATIGLLSTYDDVDRVQAALLDQGVTLDGTKVPMVVGYIPTIDDTRPERDGVAGAKKPRARKVASSRGDEVLVTTQKHIDRERAVVEMTRIAAADRSGALTDEELTAAVRRAETRTVRPLNFDSEHGQAQLAAARHLGQSERVSLVVGVAGSGKTTLAQPLVDAWKTRGMEVHGIAVAWRQANDLEDAGIPGAKEAKAPGKRGRGRSKASSGSSADATQELRDAGLSEDRLHAVAAFIKRFETGKITVDQNTVILLDEVGQLGVKDAVRLLEIQRQTGCHLKMIGDPLQCVAVEAGPTIDLLIRSLGAENVPSILSTVRQLADTEKRNAGLFRSGQADVALDHKRSDGTARLVRGDAGTFAQAVAGRWAQMADEAAAAGMTLGVSAPTNNHARAIGDAIREKRRERGEIMGEDRTVACTDSHGSDQYDLALAVGDRVRLFKKTRGRRVEGGGGVQVGVNGTIVDVKGFTATGIILSGADGIDVEVRWSTLTHRKTGRIQLNRGEVFTPDGAQGATRHLWLDTLPGGSDAMTAGKVYVTQSRHRIRAELMVSEDAEREALVRERALGDTVPITVEDVWKRVASNLSRTGAKTSAMLLAERARNLRRAAAHVVLRHQVDRAARLAHGQAPDTAQAKRRTTQEALRVALPGVARAIQRSQEASRAVQSTLRSLGAGLTRGSAGEAPAAARAVVAAVGVALRDAAPQIKAAVEAIRQRQALARKPKPEPEQPSYSPSFF